MCGLITPLLLIIGYIALATFACVYVSDHMDFKPYITPGSKVYINKLPHWY